MKNESDAQNNNGQIKCIVSVELSKFRLVKPNFYAIAKCYQIIQIKAKQNKDCGDKVQDDKDGGGFHFIKI